MNFIIPSVKVAFTIVIIWAITITINSHWSDLFGHSSTNSVTPTTVPTITPTPVASSASELIQKLCTALDDRNYKFAYEQLFSSAYQDKISYNRFDTALYGFTCNSQSRFRDLGSNDYIEVYLWNDSTNEGMCHGYTIANFTDGGWKIDIVKDAKCRY